MLINAVIVWLRETLPPLLLFSALIAMWPKQQRMLCILTGVGSVLLVGMMTWWLRPLSALIDGQGLELSYSLLYCACALLLGIAVQQGRNERGATVRYRWTGAALVCLAGVHGHKLVLFFWVYPHAASEQANLWLGSALGIGIGVSIAVLLYIAVQEGARWWPRLPAVILALLTARQCAAAVAIWLQTGWLTASEPLWDSSRLVDEQSEYGNFFNALVGYEATPDPLLLLLQLSCFALMLWHCRRLEVQE